MTTIYASITSKGQITIPVEARRELDLQTGQRLAVSVTNNSLTLSAPPDLDRLRKTIRKEAKAKGTWGTVPVANDGWSTHAEELMSSKDESSDGQH